jgi:predicted nucleic acid-binding protein
MLLDTNILIDFMRGYPPAIEFFGAAQEQFSLSVLTVAEMFAGVREGKERKLLGEALPAYHLLDVTAEIAKLAGMLKRDFHRSHSIDLIDATIAATASLHKLQLVTLNRKHFPMLRDILTPYRRT